MSKLQAFGWNDFFEEHFAPHAAQGLAAGRVMSQHKKRYLLCTEHGDLWAETTGRLRYQATGLHDLPAVGDWVAIRTIIEENKATIHAVLPRKSKFSRKVPGVKMEEQIVASNIDTILLVMGLDYDYNLRRIERYLTLAWESGGNPVVVLNKADLCDEIESRLHEVESSAPGVPVFAVSAIENFGLDSLQPYLAPGQTVALLGSSGVGKSTIINRFVGQDILKVQEVREHDSRGRHTTSRRELIMLPSGGLVMDTPGLRELQLWVGEEGIQDTFEDIEALAQECRFRDCKHVAEPGCAVQQALEQGRLNEQRFNNFVKMHKELSFLASKQDLRASLAKKEKDKKLHKMIKKVKKK